MSRGGQHRGQPGWAWAGNPRALHVKDALRGWLGLRQAWDRSSWSAPHRRCSSWVAGAKAGVSQGCPSKPSKAKVVQACLEYSVGPLHLYHLRKTAGTVAKYRPGVSQYVLC